MATHRSPGEGTVTKLPNGRWQGRVRVGKRSYTAVAKTKKQALENAQAKYREHEHIYGATIGHIASLWLATPGWTDTTRATYASRWANLLEPYWANQSVRALTTKAIAEWATRYDHNPRTKTTAIQTLTAILAEAQRLGYCDYNPASLVRKPKSHRRRPDPMTPEQAAHFLNTTTGSRFHALYATMIYAGLRSKEARMLRPQDIHDGMIHVRRETTKTDAGERRVPILPALAPILQQAIDHALANKQTWLWPTRHGTLLPAGSLFVVYKKDLERAGVSDRRIHDLRHTCGSFLTAQGVPLRIVQAILGHTRADQTMHYSQQQDDQLKAAVANLPALQ